MRSLVRAVACSWIVVVSLAGSALAQPPDPPGGSAPPGAPGTPSPSGPVVPPAPTEAGFLAMDLFGGTHPQASRVGGPNRPSATFGWEIGSSVRFRRWVGVAGSFGRVRTPERAWITHVNIGPRVSHALGALSDLRGFAHVLVGRATSELPSGATDQSLELMAGAGLDVFNVFRFELDVVRRDLETFDRTSPRFLFGVAVPLCFRQCTDTDGVAVR